MMGIVDDNGVDIGNVYTAFYDIGTHQDIVFSIYKIQNSFFQIIAFQLSMSIADTKIGTKPLYNSGHFSKPLYPVVYKEYLPASFRFVIDGIPDEILVIAMQFRLYWLSVG